VIFRNDAVADTDFAARASQVLTMFDQNKDGYLEASEVPDSLQPQLGRFEAVDIDDDGKAFPKEIEAFLSQQQAGLRAQIHARVSDIEDALFATLDADQDGRLASRELESASQRLKALDVDGDDQVTPDEIPQVIEISVARGSIETPDATFARPTIERTVSQEAPSWFTSMDANQDGVLSRREFLGTTRQFGALDRDQNGLLDAVEARTP
jgi:Ca2+-binding EF-hand superfamily protein